MKADKMKELVDRCYNDVVSNVDAYPVSWIKSDGLPFWEKKAKEDPYAEKMVELYKKMIYLDSAFNGVADKLGL